MINDVSALLARVQSLLNENKNQEALLLIQPHVRSGAKSVVSAYGVCLMRTGQLEEAVKVLRALVYANNSFSISPDVSDKIKVNFATALFLNGKVDGVGAVLNQTCKVPGTGAARLEQAIRQWKKSLSLFQRLQLLWSVPRKHRDIVKSCG